jgi:predicted nucleic acid-binding protein
MPKHCNNNRRRYRAFGSKGKQLAETGKLCGCCLELVVLESAKMAKKIYCFDTSALLQPWNTYYSMQFFPDFWNVIEALAREGILFCTEEVYREIEKKDDSLAAWVKEQPFLFREATEDVQKNLRVILESHKELVQAGKDRSRADPWVIAHAMAEGAVVVTKEGYAPRKIKIPDVCRAYEVPCIDDTQFVREIGLKISAKL